MSEIVFPAPGCPTALQYVFPFYGLDITKSLGGKFSNLLLSSCDLASPLWSKGNDAKKITSNYNIVDWYITDNDIVPSTEIYITGTKNGEFVFGSNSATQYLTQTVTVSPNTLYTFSFYARKGTATEVTCSIKDNNNIDLIPVTNYYDQLDAVAIRSTSSTVIGQLGNIDTQITNTVYTRIIFSFVTGYNTYSIDVSPIWNISNGQPGTVYLHSPQLELGSSATVYDPTINVSGYSIGTTGADSINYFPTSNLSRFNLPDKIFDIIPIYGQSAVTWNSVDEYIYDNDILTYSKMGEFNRVYFPANVIRPVLPGDSVFIVNSDSTYKEQFTVLDVSGNSITLNTTTSFPMFGMSIVNTNTFVYPQSIVINDFSTNELITTKTSFTPRENLYVSTFFPQLRGQSLIGQSKNFVSGDIQKTMPGVFLSANKLTQPFKYTLDGSVKTVFNPIGFTKETSTPGNVSLPIKIRATLGITSPGNLKNVFSLTYPTVTQGINYLDKFTTKPIEISTTKIAQGNVISAAKLKSPYDRIYAGRMSIPTNLTIPYDKLIQGNVTSSAKIKGVANNVYTGNLKSNTVIKSAIEKIYISTYLDKFKSQLSGSTSTVKIENLSFFSDPTKNFDPMMITGQSTFMWNIVSDYIYDTDILGSTINLSNNVTLFYANNIGRTYLPGDPVYIVNDSTGLRNSYQVIESSVNSITINTSTVFVVPGTYISNPQPQVYPQSFVIPDFSSTQITTKATFNSRERLYSATYFPWLNGVKVNTGRILATPGAVYSPGKAISINMLKSPTEDTYKKSYGKLKSNIQVKDTQVRLKDVASVTRAFIQVRDSTIPSYNTGKIVSDSTQTNKVAIFTATMFRSSFTSLERVALGQVTPYLISKTVLPLTSPPMVSVNDITSTLISGKPVKINAVRGIVGIDTKKVERYESETLSTATYRNNLTYLDYTLTSVAPASSYTPQQRYTLGEKAPYLFSRLPISILSPVNNKYSDFGKLNNFDDLSIPFPAGTSVKISDGVFNLTATVKSSTYNSITISADILVPKYGTSLTIQKSIEYQPTVYNVSSNFFETFINESDLNYYYNVIVTGNNQTIFFNSVYSPTAVYTQSRVIKEMYTWITQYGSGLNNYATTPRERLAAQLIKPNNIPSTQLFIDRNLSDTLPPVGKIQGNMSTFIVPGDFRKSLLGQTTGIYYNTARDYIFDADLTTSTTSTLTSKTVYFAAADAVPYPTGEQIRIVNTLTGYTLETVVNYGSKDSVVIDLPSNFPATSGSYIERINSSLYPQSLVNPVGAASNPREALFYFNMAPGIRANSTLQTGLSFGVNTTPITLGQVNRQIVSLRPDRERDIKVERLTTITPLKSISDTYRQVTSVTRQIVPLGSVVDRIKIIGTGSPKIVISALRDYITAGANLAKGKLVVKAEPTRLQPTVINKFKTYPIAPTTDISTYYLSKFHNVEFTTGTTYTVVTTDRGITNNAVLEYIFDLDIFTTVQVPVSSLIITFKNTSIVKPFFEGNWVKLTSSNNVTYITTVISSTVDSITVALPNNYDGTIFFNSVVSASVDIIPKSSVFPTSSPINSREALFYSELAPGYRSNKSITQGAAFTTDNVNPSSGTINKKILSVVSDSNKKFSVEKLNVAIIVKSDSTKLTVDKLKISSPIVMGSEGTFKPNFFNFKVPYANTEVFYTPPVNKLLISVALRPDVTVLSTGKLKVSIKVGDAPVRVEMDRLETFENPGFGDAPLFSAFAARSYYDTANTVLEYIKDLDIISSASIPANSLSIYFNNNSDKIAPPYPVGSYVVITQASTHQDYTVQVLESSFNYVRVTLPTAFGDPNGWDISNISSASVTVYPASKVRPTGHPTSPREALFYSEVAPGYRSSSIIPSGKEFSSFGLLPGIGKVIDKEDIFVVRDIKLGVVQGLVYRFDIGRKMNKVQDVSYRKKEPIQFWN